MKTVIFMLVLAGATTLQAQQGDEPRHCKTAQLPRKLPAVSAVLDSAQAAAAFSGERLPSGGIVFSVINLQDSVQTVRLLDPHVVDSMPQALRVFKGTLIPPKVIEIWGVRVRIQPGGQISLERTEYCPPKLLANSLEIVRFDVTDEDRPMNAGGRPLRITIEATLSPLGDAIDARVVRSSGIKELDRELMDSFRRQKFLPALLDSVPVTSWIRNDGHYSRL